MVGLGRHDVDAAAAMQAPKLGGNTRGVGREAGQGPEREDRLDAREGEADQEGQQHHPADHDLSGLRPAAEPGLYRVWL